MTEGIRVKFIISEDIDVQRIGDVVQNNVIINPIFVMRTRFIPTSLSFGLTIVAKGLDFTQSHDFEIKIINQSNDEIIYTTGSEKIPANISQPIDNFTFNLRLNNIAFEHEGEYNIELILDDISYFDTFEVYKNE